MNVPSADVLFHPFHLCHERTLRTLLASWARVHFRDYMALQLGPFFGTTAFPDRMGDRYPDLVAEGRIRQGYDVSGPLSDAVLEAVERDLSDPAWRARFHSALTDDPRFQQGLFGAPFAREAHPLTTDRLRAHPFSVASIQALSGTTGAQDASVFDYGFALLKTSAALVYTVRLAGRHRLAVATDSPRHDALLVHSTGRDGLRLENHLIERVGY